MRSPSSLFLVTLLAIATLPAGSTWADESLHVTHLWHLDQPIYWPAPNQSGYRYQTAWDSIQAKRTGAAHPENDLEEVFRAEDRVAVYQYRHRDAIAAMLAYGEAGAQVSYSGSLIENVASLGAAGQFGYSSSWADAFREARTWQTSGGHPRLDLMISPFHQPLMPLVDPEVARMETALHQHIQAGAWGEGPRSLGLFPPEMAFTEHLIPILADAGIEWVIVSNSHISRACEDYPWVPGAEGDKISPPNRADVQNPAQDDYMRIPIDRGVSPANAVPFSYQPHRARYVDPETGAESSVIVVPAAQSESWEDGSSCFGVEQLDALAPYNDTQKPILLLLAHDGDKAFAGSYSYYMEGTPTSVAAAAGAGYTPITIQQYLSDHPPAQDDVVHVESGAWVNADGDFGAPLFPNWNWPLVDPSGQLDLADGWSVEGRNWAVITAATNHVLTAQAAAERSPNLDGITNPQADTGDLELAWHFLLASLNSGYMDEGKLLDMELKPTVACNEAVAHAQAVHLSTHDNLGPTIWFPQRYPYNPAGTNFGPLSDYQQVVGSGDFWVWTFAHDVSGVQSATLKIRVDEDGRDPLTDDANQTYAGGPGVGNWVSLPMTRRIFPTGNPFDDPEMDTSILPAEIAELFYVQVTGYREVMLDYYVEATDHYGLASRSIIQHVYIGDQDPIHPPEDGGPPDSGPEEDGGSTEGGGAAEDGGVEADGGEQAPEESGGCGCSLGTGQGDAGPLGTILPGLLLLGMAFRRRTRRFNRRACFQSARKISSGS